jgi:hypothetical protein
MLIPNKFSGYSEDGIRKYNIIGKLFAATGIGGLLGLGRGSAPPPPPDYAAAAKETAAGNLEAARYATRANRINQVTPYGSLSYKQGPVFDQAGYDKAMAEFNAEPHQGSFISAIISAPRREQFMSGDEDTWTQTMNLTPQAQATLDKQMKLSDQYADTASKGFANVQGLLENPNIDLSGMPEMRGIDMSQVSGIRDLNQEGLGGVRDLNTGNLNNIRRLGVDGLPQAPINAGQTAQEALFSRLNPTLSRDDEALRTRLANQGIALGSSAYNREMELAGQRANDLRLQAAAQGISLDQAARQQAFGENQAMTAADLAQRGQMFGENQAMTNADLARQNQQFGQRQAMSLFDINRANQQFGQQQNLAALSGNQRNQALQEAYTRQSRPLDLVNALRTGAQVQNPQFQQFAQQQTTTGPDMLGAANAQYGAQMNAFNAKQASNDAMMGGLMGIGGQFAGSAAGSAALAGLF